MISKQISDGTYTETPFPYYICHTSFDPEFSYTLLNWLQTEAPWSLTVADFYEQYEFSFFDVDLPASLSCIKLQNYSDTIKHLVASKFNTRLAENFDLTAHKLTAGQTIRLHNDYIEGQETHRVIIQLNNGWEMNQGGLLMLFNSKDPADIHRALLPVHNSCLAFEISQKSNHAVSTILSGERYTMVYSFYRLPEEKQ
ncbi:MAG: cyclophane-containing peptide 2OG-Fe(II) oxygenase YhhC [Pseudohongiella sp.]|nr:cyclophane-containing peptide 2OG-Fe(II) oxygenase YhhC [Pseudohongiella sp.]